MAFPRIIGLLLFALFLLCHSAKPLHKPKSPFVVLQIGAASKNKANVERKVKSNGKSSSGALRLEMMHWDSPASPFQGQNTTRKQLIMQRLRRDVLRSKAIADQIKLAINGLNASDLKPVVEKSDLDGEKFQGPLIPGISSGSGDYFVRLGVGTPAKKVYMVADTGSDLSWLQCSPCSRCYTQNGPIFDPSGSKSFQRLTCKSTLCSKLKIKGCKSNKCMYQVSYGDGSFTVGDFSTETLSFGSTYVKNVAFGCGHNNQGLFHGAGGLLGLGKGPLSFPSVTSKRYGSVFSYCLPNRESEKSASLVFGKDAVPENAQFTGLVSNPKLETYYYVGLSQIKVGGEPVDATSDSFLLDSSGEGGVIMDSGTAVTRLNTPVYNALRSAFRAACNLPRASGISLFDTCYDLSGINSAKVPSVDLEFEGGATMSLPADNILVNVDDSGTYCLAFAPEDQGFSIIGNVQQQTFRISFDAKRNELGIAPDQCS